MALPEFKNASLLQRALTHRSYLNEHSEAFEDNERLEFLGDAVLDFLTAAFLYNRLPEMKEGRLTRLRAALVRTEQLAALAGQVGIGEMVRLGRGEEEGGGRQRRTLLCDTFEAVIGALYLDSGFEAVRLFIEPLFEPVLDEILRAEMDADAKSRLQEIAQAEYGVTPHYVIVRNSGPDHDRVFTARVFVGDEPLGEGSGPSKRAAEQAAARAALERLGASDGAA
ncbi:MAG: ribonuclease III [Anaerolineales bacterium]|nr:ribonuclease III [Anaerolineales bacterium]